ncbi:MAG: hypothetical protein P4L84_30690 [Isosphaeraceae bacterium]|nr:hypothetical protein [Isosphaeraceae bacterium]
MIRHLTVGNNQIEELHATVRKIDTLLLWVLVFIPLLCAGLAIVAAMAGRR